MAKSMYIFLICCLQLIFLAHEIVNMNYPDFNYSM